MDLSGRSAGYRSQAIRCPGCAEGMEQKDLPSCEVDVCASCGGIWVDWFDGEIRAVTGQAMAVGVSAEGEGPAASRNEPPALGACPRCTRQLVPERYVLTAEVPLSTAGKTSTISTPTGAELLRCEDCAGAFVSRTSAEMLAMLDGDEAPPSERPRGGKALSALPWQRFVGLLRGLLRPAG